MSDRAHAWLWGWDPTPGIVSVWAGLDGQVSVWRRQQGRLLHEPARFEKIHVSASFGKVGRGILRGSMVLR